MFSHRDGADTGAVVGAALAFQRRIPVGDRIDARLEFQGRRHPIAQGKLLPERNAGIVVVHVDEARRHDVAGGIDGLPASDRLFGDSGNLTSSDSHIVHGIQARFRVDDSAVLDDNIV